MLGSSFNNIYKIASLASGSFVDAEHVFTGQSEKTALPDCRSSKKGTPLIVVFF